MSLNDYVKELHEIAKSKGWWDKENEDPTKLNPLEKHMLMVTELAEAAEEARVGNPPIYFIEDENGNQKPEGQATELADCMIRICDYFGYMGWDLEHVINIKKEYNKTRSYRHGDKKY